MNDVATLARPVLPASITELIAQLQSIPEQPQFIPPWLPPGPRYLAESNEWGNFGPLLVMDQDRIDKFADAVGDYQAIHINPVLAKTRRFGGIIAHGDLTTSLDVYLIPEFSLLLEMAEIIRINKYGKLTRPVYLGAHIYMRMRIISCHRPKRVESGVEIVYEFEAIQKVNNQIKRLAVGFGTILCLPTFCP